MSTLGQDTSVIWQDLREVWPDLDWARLDSKHGAFHHVAVLGDSSVVRVSTARRHEEQTLREYQNLSAVQSLGLPLRTPRVRCGPEVRAGFSALVTSFIPGEHDLKMVWSQVREPVAEILHSLRESTVPELHTLRPVRQWCGGEQWPRIIEQLSSALDETVARTARRVVADVLTAEPDNGRTLVHGDFGLHNLLWGGHGLPAVIDWDNASVGDPAIDLAPLIGMFGADAVGEIADTDLVERAQRHRASLPLQVAAAADLAGDLALRNFALDNFTKRFRNDTLYDIAG
ncbi:MAG TPA: aminoglycoside phosphotransferase family protein [Rhizobiaceae bacterium]|nr:aminoglycoside phosphotransferase family protein [Rhizobiaceae bacterium]